MFKVKLFTIFMMSFNTHISTLYAESDDSLNFQRSKDRIERLLKITKEERGSVKIIERDVANTDEEEEKKRRNEFEDIFKDEVIIEKNKQSE